MLRGVNPRDAGGPFGTDEQKCLGKNASAACVSMLVHVYKVITGRRGHYVRISMN